MSQPTYRKIYLAHVRTIVNDYLVDSTYLQRAIELQGMIDEHVMQDTNQLYNYEAFKKNLYESAKAGKVNIIGIAELMRERAAYLQAHSSVSKIPPTVSKVEHLDFGDMIVFNANLEGANKAWLFYRYGKKGAFQKIEMFDDSGHADEMEADGIWGNTLDKKKKKDIQYYIVAENDHTAAVFPERASYEFLTTAEKSGSDASKNNK